MRRYNSDLPNKLIQELHRDQKKQGYYRKISLQNFINGTCLGGALIFLSPLLSAASISAGSIAGLFRSNAMKQPASLAPRQNLQVGQVIPPNNFYAKAVPGYDPLSLQPLFGIGGHYNLSPQFTSHLSAEWRPKVRYFSGSNPATEDPYQSWIGGNLNGGIRGFYKNYLAGAGLLFDALQSNSGGVINASGCVEAGAKAFKFSFFSGSGLNALETSNSQEKYKKFGGVRHVGTSFIFSPLQWLIVDLTLGTTRGENIRPASIANTLELLSNPWFGHFSVTCPLSSCISLSLGMGSDNLTNQNSSLKASNFLTGGLALSIDWSYHQNFKVFKPNNIDVWARHPALSMTGYRAFSYNASESADTRSLPLEPSITRAQQSQNNRSADKTALKTALNSVEKKSSLVTGDCATSEPALIKRKAILNTRTPSVAPVSPKSMRGSKLSKSAALKAFEEPWTHSTLIQDVPYGENQCAINSKEFYLSNFDLSEKTSSDLLAEFGIKEVKIGREKLYKKIYSEMLEQASAPTGFTKFGALLFNVEVPVESDWPTESDPWSILLYPGAILPEWSERYNQNVAKSYRLLRSDSIPGKGFLAVILSYKDDADIGFEEDTIFSDALILPYNWNYFFSDVLGQSVSNPGVAPLRPVQGQENPLFFRQSMWKSAFLKDVEDEEEKNQYDLSTRINFTSLKGRFKCPTKLPFYLDGLPLVFTEFDTSHHKGDDKFSEGAISIIRHYALESEAPSAALSEQVLSVCCAARNNDTNTYYLANAKIPVDNYLFSPALLTFDTALKGEQRDALIATPVAVSEVEKTFSMLENKCSNHGYSIHPLDFEAATKVLKTLNASAKDYASVTPIYQKFVDQKCGLYYAAPGDEGLKMLKWGSKNIDKGYLFVSVKANN